MTELAKLLAKKDSSKDSDVIKEKESKMYKESTNQLFYMKFQIV